MAKNGSKRLPKQMLEDFHRRLSRGETIDLAASKAGLNDPQHIHDAVAEFYANESTDNHLEAEAISMALSTLKEICSNGTEEDKVRCDAAKALLGFVKGGKQRRTVEKTQHSVSVTSENVKLWDFEK